MVIGQGRIQGFGCTNIRDFYVLICHHINMLGRIDVPYLRVG